MAPETVAPTRKRRPGAGRPPGGPAGERIRDYPRVMLRLPPLTAAKLKAWSNVTGVPAWKLIADAIEAAVGQLHGVDAEDVRRLAKRYVGRFSSE